MRVAFVTRALFVGALALLPVVAQAQEATITGTVTDTTGAVLPGVTVLAVHEASGNQFEGITDGRGVYRIPVRVGTWACSFSWGRR
ncbi:MAG: carboxypeptidase regulatory-like domain-containing protein [Acidobacteria bacterium]|nr:carboxypeptidase regulatory-like domain-containing protein [Acidobacteriota bacterium]